MDSDHIHYFETTSEAASWLLENGMEKNDVILVKGSRGMTMETIVEELEEKE
jgi:UDP-N-acetylmuramoyl-tripeptide--D-alanyl-D-alanine ligase